MTVGFDGIRTVDGDSQLSYYDRLVIASLGMEYPRDTFMVYSPNSTDDRGMSWLLSIANVHNKTPYKALNKWTWRNCGGIYTDFNRHGVKVFHGLDSVLPMSKNKDNVKMVTTVRDLTFDRLMDDYTWLERVTRKSRIKKACNRANRVIATSNYIKQQLVDKFKMPAEKVDVVYTAFRDEYLQNQDDKVFLSNVKGKYHLPSNYVLAITDMAPLGNLETLYKAFAQISDKRIDLVLIGQKSNYYRQLKRLAAKLGIDERVVRVSSVNKHNFMALYKMAQAFVAPTLNDGMGQTLIEAMITGTPVIASDSGCHREIAGDAAAYFKPSDDSQLASQLDEVLQNQSKRDAMIKAGRDHAQQFTQQAMAQNTMHCYNRARGRE